MIGAPEVWSSRTGRGVRIAIVDTGLDANHAAIAPNLIEKPGERRRPTRAVLDSQRVEVARLLAQPAAMTLPPPHFDGRQDLADVLEGPAIPRRSVPV